MIDGVGSQSGKRYGMGCHERGVERAREAIGSAHAIFYLRIRRDVGVPLNRRANIRATCHRDSGNRWSRGRGDRERRDRKAVRTVYPVFNGPVLIIGGGIACLVRHAYCPDFVRTVLGRGGSVVNRIHKDARPRLYSIKRTVRAKDIAAVRIGDIENNIGNSVHVFCSGGKSEAGSGRTAGRGY